MTTATNYLKYNSTVADPKPVIGVGYTPDGTLPPGTIPCSSAQAEAWQGSTIVAGAIVAPSAPSASQVLLASAMAALNQPIYIALTGSITLSSTPFPIDTLTIIKINSVVNQINSSKGFFFNNSPTGLMKDANPTPGWHVFSAPQYLIVASAIGAYVSGLMEIVDGNPNNMTVLPNNTVSLTV